MLGLSSTVQIALGILAVALLLLLTPLGRRKPKRAEKWEKAEIMRKLLALSENENGAKLSTSGKPVRVSASRPIAGRPVARKNNLPVKGNTKGALPVQSKAR